MITGLLFWLAGLIAIMLAAVITAILVPQRPAWGPDEIREYHDAEKARADTWASRGRRLAHWLSCLRRKSSG
jgi:hypothetical protein